MDTTTQDTTTVTPILDDETIGAILEALSHSTDPTAEAVAEHVFSDTDESPYYPYGEVVDLTTSEIATIRTALDERCMFDSLTKFDEAIAEETR